MDNQEIENAELGIRGMLYQVITVQTEDGRKCSYTGRYQLDGWEPIVGITITPARKLPDGMTWDTIPTGEEGVIDENDK